MMLKALGIGKKHKCASDGEIHAFRQELTQRDQWKKNSDAGKEIITILDQGYLLHKGEFPVLRYRNLKCIIKAANLRNTDLKETLHENEANRQRMKYYERTGDTDAVKNIGLKQQLAESYAKECSELSDDEQFKAMTKEQVKEDTKSLHREVLQYNEQYRAVWEILDKLESDYENSKRLNPIKRYSELKRMTKATVGQSTCLANISCRANADSQLATQVMPISPGGNSFHCIFRPKLSIHL